MTEKKEGLEALSLALKTEDEGYHLYRNAIEKSSDNFTKSVFTQLAKDELMHKDLIKRFYDQLAESGSWKVLTEEEKDYENSKKNIKTIFSQALTDAKSGKAEFTRDDVSAYKKAVEFEKRGVDMYSALAEKSDDSQAKTFYTFLQQMEEEHYELLEKALKYLNSPDNYYLLEEGRTLDD